MDLPDTNYLYWITLSDEMEIISFGSNLSSQPTGEKSNEIKSDELKLIFPNKGKIIKKLNERNNGIKGEHNKFSKDNIRKKVINIIINGIFRDFINTKINNKQYELKKLNSNEFKKAKIIKHLLEKKLKDIFSFPINTTYKRFEKNYNEMQINKLEEENNEIKDILNTTLSECLKYFIKKEEALNDDKLYCLNGLEQYYEELIRLKEEKKNKIINLEENDEDTKSYLEIIIDLIDNFDQTLFNIKERHKRGKNNIE